MHHCYLFESKSIQSYVLGTNRIKEIVGASELIESLTGPPLNAALDAARARDAVRFSRRAGGAFYAFSEDSDAIDRLAALWSVAVVQYAPGLDYLAAVGRGDTDMAAFDDARATLAAERNALAMTEPQAGPFVARSQRTGLPASRFLKGPEAVSESTWRKTFFSDDDTLPKRFAPDSNKSHWPLALSPEDQEGGRPGKRDFPYLDERRLLAVIHADGNGLGQVLLNLREAVAQQPEAFFDVYSDFSHMIDEVTTGAAKAATEQVLEPARVKDIYPARPIVLAGEDLTMIVRADLAVPFCEAFIREFSKLSGKALRRMGKAKKNKSYRVKGLPARLTACAGIAFVHSTQPYHAAYGLAEDLCDHAKTASTRAKANDDDAIPSSIAFHRVTTAIIDDYDDILKHEMTHNGLCATLTCYAVDNNPNLPALENLKGLIELTSRHEMARGPTRELLALVADGKDGARRRYQRWREVLQARAPGTLSKFDTQLESTLGQPPAGDLPFSAAEDDAVRFSPLGDVELLTHIGGVEMLTRDAGNPA